MANTELRTATELSDIDTIDTVLLPVANADPAKPGVFAMKLAKLKAYILAGASGSGVPNGGDAGQVLTKLSDDDGDADWLDPTGGSGGGPASGMVMIDELQLGGLSEITLANISQGFSELELVFTGNVNGTAGTPLNFQFNGDVANGKYNWSSRYSNPADLQTQVVASSGNTTGFAAISVAQNTSGISSARLQLANYNDNVNYKEFDFKGRQGGSAATNAYYIDGVASYNDVTVISSIRLFLAAGKTFAAGSKVRLYGLPKVPYTATIVSVAQTLGAIALAAGWSVGDANYSDPVAIKTGRVVTLGGYLLGPTTLNVSCGNLPVGFRPAKKTRCVTQGSGNSLAYLEIQPNGDILRLSSNGANVSLECSFVVP